MGCLRRGGRSSICMRSMRGCRGARPAWEASKGSSGGKVAQERGRIAALSAAVRATLRAAQLEAPRRGASRRPGEIELALWPEWAGTLSMPQGRSKAQRFCWLFGAAGGSTVEDLLRGAPRHHLRPVVGWLDPADAVEAGATWDAPRLFTGAEPGAGIFSWVPQSAAARLESVGEMFHYGDSPHSGHTASYAGLAGDVPEGGPGSEGSAQGC